jgi:hypothetical protein
VNWLVFKNTGAGFDKFVPKDKGRPDEQLRNVVEEDMRRRMASLARATQVSIRTQVFCKHSSLFPKLIWFCNRQIKGASS